MLREFVGEIAVQIEARADWNVGLHLSHRAQQVQFGIVAFGRDARAMQRQIDRVELLAGEIGDRLVEKGGEDFVAVARGDGDRCGFDTRAR